MQDKKGSVKKSGPITASEVQMFNRTASTIADYINHLKLGLQDVEKGMQKATNQSNKGNLISSF